MNKINYNNKYFRSVINTDNGEVNSSTIFHYRQESNVVWATYKGGDILYGNLIAKVNEDNSLNMRYHHINTKGEIMTGICHSTPEILDDGRIRLYEEWQWTSGDYSKGRSIVEQIETM
jgi:hypothetical protein